MFRLFSILHACVVIALLVISPAAAAPSITSFTPASGTIDTKVTINGTGFAGTTTVKIGGVQADFVVNSGMKITATVPAMVATGKISVTTPTGTDISATSFKVLPGAKVSPRMGSPTKTIQIDGVGFRAQRSIDVYIDTTHVALAVSNAKGAVAISTKIPASLQPGQHWITLEERNTGVAAQEPFLVNTNWAMHGFNIAGRGLNQFENTLTTSNVSQLTEAWSGEVAQFTSRTALVVANGTTFLGDFNGVVRAYSADGVLLWMHDAAATFQNPRPALLGTRVFFAAIDGTVFAFLTTCRNDGGNCDPLWTKSVGASIAGGITAQGNRLFVPSSDGTVHVLNPVNGDEDPAISWNDASTAITTPFAVDGDGGEYYARGDVLHFRKVGISVSATKAGAISPLAVHNGFVHFTTADGMLNRTGINSSGSDWTVATSGTNCIPGPVVANNTVFAGGCTSLAAFEASNGTLRWSVTTPGPVIGLTLANGILFACVNQGGGFGFAGIVVAYSASSGLLLWSGAGCMDAPAVVNGRVYAALAELIVYKLPEAEASRRISKPDVGSLRPDPRIKPQWTPNLVLN
jgi:hypothetical protein